MRHIILLILFLNSLAISCNSQKNDSASSNNRAMNLSPNTIYDFTMNLINGNAQPLSEYKGKVVIIVNVASACGYTPQYKELQETWEKYNSEGLVILGFPANEFGSQEPGTNEEIVHFCRDKYGVTFPMFEKIIVKGEGIHPLYQYLTEEKLNGVKDFEVKWNFYKFLIDKTGHIVNLYKSSIKPTDEVMVEAIEAELGR